MTTTASVISQTFAKFYEGNDEVISLKELKEKLSQIYKGDGKTETKKTTKKATTKKEEKPEKKTKEPSAYNTFMKEQMAILKEEQSSLSKEEKPSAKDNMKKIAELWQQQKKSDK